MKQYCRYCVNLCVNNFPFCIIKDKELKESYCKSANNCKDYIFADVENEYQDAFGETKGYKPRNTRKRNTTTENYEQLKFEL